MATIDKRQASAKRPLLSWAEVKKADAFDALGALPADSVDLICTSPPYWGHRTYGQTHDGEILTKWQKVADDPKSPPGFEWYRRNGGVLGLEPYPHWYIAHLVEILGQARGALKPRGNVWVNLGDTYFGRWASIRPDGRQGLNGSKRTRRRTPSGGWLHDKQLLLIPSRFAISMQEDGWILRNDLIWAKPSMPPRPERDRLRSSHEHFFHFVQRTKGGRPSYFYDLEGSEDGGLDVVTMDSSKVGKGHPAVFPKDLIRPRIETSCPKGGTVLDPFCGSGTTLVAAGELGRNGIGFDVSAGYLRTARGNLREISTLEVKS